MKYLLEIYRNKEIIDTKYSYTLEELREWYKDLYANTETTYILYELRDKGNYFKGSE